MFRILGLGELLWDLLPEGPQLGGAPANYTVMAGRLGNDARVISRIGSDPLGEKALEVLRPFPVDCHHVQVDPQLPTGGVTVTLESGQPSYEIHQPVAWDALESTADWLEQASSADAVCFGSLCQRNARSRATIQIMLEATQPACLRIFDVNLRAPFYDAEIIRESLLRASVMKMNDVEVPTVLKLLHLGDTGELREGAERILSAFPQLSLLAITCGASGSLLVSPSEYHQHPGVPTRVADTIGAGDAFTAALTHYLLRGAPLPVLNEAGNRWGSFIASCAGAMPPIPAERFAQFSAEIEGTT